MIRPVFWTTLSVPRFGNTQHYTGGHPSFFQPAARASVPQTGPTLKLFIPEGKVLARIKGLAEELYKEYQGKPLTLVCTLQGAKMMTYALAKHLRKMGLTPYIVDVSASSYGTNLNSSGQVVITATNSNKLKNRHVVILDEVVDTGRTLSALAQYCNKRKPRSLKTLVLVDKFQCRASGFADVKPDFTGFQVMGSPFLVGWGMDAGEGKYRTHRGISIYRQPDPPARAFPEDQL
jgi:hypoxanthine phosphoribosyltransferase